MVENESTKNGPGQSLAAGAEPDAMQQESPRKCKICGGPNHHGCGCEARQRRAAVQVGTENIFKSRKPAEETAKIADDQSPTDEEIADTIERGEKLFGHIEAMSDNLSDLCGVLQQCRELLKSINDNILAKKIVEVKNAPSKN